MRRPSLSLRVQPREFRGLFRMITQASLASGLVGCATDSSVPGVSDAGAVDAAVQADGSASGDAGTASDARVTEDSATTNADGSVLDDAGSPPYVALPCDNGAPSLGAVQSQPASGYVGVFASPSAYFERPAPDPSVPDYYPVLETGSTPCSSTCDSAFIAARDAVPCGGDAGTTCARMVVYGRSGTYARVESREALLSFFGGSIDTLAEAALLAAFEGHAIVCSGSRTDIADYGTRYFSDSAGVHVLTIWEDCGSPVRRESYLVTADGSIRDVSNEEIAPGNCAIGRRPDGLCTRPAARAGIAGYLSQAAELEAASVHAFAKLSRELAALGAPGALTRAADRALCDEVRHADVIARLARRYGGSPRVPAVADTALRSAFDIASDNAREGCVRETFGALLATYQAAAATDKDVQHAMAHIAEDETRHAQLSWEIASWLEPQLSTDEHAQVVALRASALAELEAELDARLSADDRAALGLPELAVAKQLFGQLRDTLWA